jgi:hypothetical protein
MENEEGVAILQIKKSNYTKLFPYELKALIE